MRTTQALFIFIWSALRPLPRLEGVWGMISATVGVLVAAGVLGGSIFAGLQVSPSSVSRTLPSGEEITVKADSWPFAFGIPVFAGAVLVGIAGVRQVRRQIPTFDLSVGPVSLTGRPVNGTTTPAVFRSVLVRNKGGSISGVRATIHKFHIVTCEAAPSKTPNEGHRLPWSRDGVEDAERFHAILPGHSTLSIDLVMLRGDDSSAMRVPAMYRSPGERPSYEDYLLSPGIYELVVRVGSVDSGRPSAKFIGVRISIDGERHSIDALEIPVKSVSA